MFISLRSLLFSFIGSMLLSAIPLCAEEAPPLPPPNTNNMQLKGLAALISGTGKLTQKSEPPAIKPTIEFRRTPQNGEKPEQLPPPKTIQQASFTTIPLDQLPQETVKEEQPTGSELHAEPITNEPVIISNNTLDKPLFTKKSESSENNAESEIPKTGGWRNKLAKPELTPVVSVGGSLLIVIAAFFLLAIVLRKVAPKGSRPLPSEAFECLGRYYLTQKHQVQLLRLGNRIVLVSIMPDGVSTLAEITDPDEAVALLGLCRRLDTNSATEMFRKTVAGISEEELNRSHERPAVTRRRKPQSPSTLDVYSDPDESLAAILARGRQYR